MYRFELKSEFILKLFVRVIVLTCFIFLAMRVQMKQSNFENSIDSIEFSRKLAYDSNKELKEYVDKNYVQQIIWKTHALQKYPDSFSSRILLKKEENRHTINETWDSVIRLAQDYSDK